MKKLLAILGMITCMVGLTACGGKEEALDEFSQTLLSSCEGIVGTVDQIVAVGGETQEQYADLYDGLLSWKDSLEDIGSYEGTDGGTVDTTDDGYVVTVNVLGSDHDATMEFIIDGETLTIAGFTTNVVYTFGEQMERAALNTLLGMGTVFVILIMISAIISCFSVIPKIQAKQKKKKAEAKANAGKAEADPVVTQIAEKEELSDDTELVAVIAAAVAAYEGSASTDGFVVRSIRKSNKSKWQKA